MTMPELAEGTMIDGRYRVLSRLGAGGMAEVFLAEDQQLGRKVALKLLHRRFAEDPDFVERFRREAQAAAGLQHPNVVGVYDRGAFDSTYYIAMEYLPGRSLKQLIRQEAPLDSLRAIDITLQILKAARFAHRRGVIHRDLKPHNVIIDDADQAKVTDFGIARAGASDMTETGSIMGTAQYLSPEQAQGHAVSARSDLYSIGVILYELLTARVPFDAESAVTIALKHVSEPPPPPHTLNPAVPPALEQVVLWALNKDPAHRPADADQMITALQQVREQIVAGDGGQRTAVVPVVEEVPPPVVEEPVLVEDGGHRLWPWLLALLLLLLIGGGAAAYLLTRPAQKVVPPVTRETLNTARTQLQNAGFSVAVLNVTSNTPAGIVIGQDPPGGAKANEHSTVTLTVSQGPGNTTVPSVQGLSLPAAERRLRAAKLKAGRVVYRGSAQVPQGDVIATDPAAGQNPSVGTAVTLIVSSGKPQVSVPDVTGQSEGAARATLQKAGFSVSTSTQQSTSVASGQVISQNPAGGSKVASGSTVTLVIAKAPAKVNVPDVTGQTAAAARSSLSSAGFKVTKRTKSVTDQTQGGVVISQSPGGGSSAQKGSTVTIVVGHFKAPPPPTTSSTTPSTTTPTTTGP